MIDICFGDSQYGILRVALKKKDVLCGYDMLDLGRLAAPDLQSAREQWAKEHFSSCSAWDRFCFISREKKRMRQILSFAKKGEIPRIWVASEPRSRCGLYQLVYTLQDIAEKIFVVDFPDDTGYCQGGKDRSWGEASFALATENVSLQRELTSDEKMHFSKCWERLVAENSELRVNENGEIKSVPIDYLDKEILLFSPEGVISFIGATGEILGRTKHIISDSFVIGRIEAMIETGKYEVIKKAGPGEDYYKKTLLKKVKA